MVEIKRQSAAESSGCLSWPVTIATALLAGWLVTLGAWAIVVVALLALGSWIASRVYRAAKPKKTSGEDGPGIEK